MLLILTGMIGAGTYIINKVKKDILKEQELSDKHLALFQMMNQWVKAKQQNKCINNYLYNSGIKKIAIYGMSYVGETLVEELKNTNIEILYCIDNNIEGHYLGIPILNLSENFENVDAIVVTAITHFNSIKNCIGDKVDAKIMSLEEIIYDM